MRVLVTGGIGFIGSHLCEFLLKKIGFEIWAIDNFDPFYEIQFKENNKKILENFPNFKFIRGDVENRELMNSLFENNSFDLVIHLAARAGVRPSLKKPFDYLRTNIEGTVSVLESMRKGKCNKFIFASSSSIYGTSLNIPFKEDAPFDSAISHYASTKQSGELFTKMYHNLYGFDVINLRFFTVYGPRQRPDLAIFKFLNANMKEKTITLFGDGNMARDYTFVQDTVKGIVGAMDRIMGMNGICEVYNLGNSSPVTLNQLIESIDRVTGKKSQVEYEEVPLGDVPITYADISLAREKLGYDPSTPLENGLKEFVDWMRINTL